MDKIELILTADPSQAKSGVASLRKEYEKFANEIQRPLSGIDNLREIQESAKAASTAYFGARKRVQDLKAAADGAGQPIKGLAQEISKAERQLIGATREFERQKTAVKAQRAELKAAGVDTRNLNGEQQRLQAEMAKFRTDSARMGIARLAAEQKRAQVSARDLSLQQARSNLGVTQARAAQQSIADLRRQYELLRSSGSLTTRELSIAHEQLNKKIAQAKQEMSGLQGGGSATGISGLASRGGLALGAAGGVAGLAVASAAYSKALDPIKKMDAQLKLATASQEEFTRAQQETFRLSQENQAPLEDVVGLYARLAPALKEAGRTQGDALKIIDAVTKSLRISGASAEETASTIQQFSQALGSGVLRGEEFNTLAESSPRLLKALADGINVNVSALRSMAAEGKLTASVITDSLIGQLPKLAEEAAVLPETYSGAVTKFQNETTLLLKAFDEITGASGKAVGGVNSLAEAIAKIRSGELLDAFRSQAETAGGIRNEMSVLLSQIRDLQNARASLKSDDPTDTFFFKFRFYDKSEADAELKAMESDLERIRVRLREVERAEQESNTKREQEEKEASEQRRKIKEQELQDDKKILEQSLKDAKAALAERISEERKAAKEIEDAKKVQLDTQKRYTDALNKLQSGSSGEASFGQAQDLRLQARQALRDGDVEKAKSSAQAALKVLSDLQDAGENTYGFAGFIKSLKAIEDEADKVTLDKEEKGAADALALVAQLKDELDKVNKTVISVKLDDVALDKARQELRDLAALTGQTITLPERVANPQASRSKSASALAAGIDPTYGAPKAKDEPVATVPVAVKPTAIVQDGENSYSNLPPVAVDIAPKGIRQDGENSFTNLPPVGVDVQVDQEAAAVAQQTITSLSTQFRQQMVIPVVPVVQGTAPAASDADVPKFATGGILRGAGSGTSDSLLIRASNGEGIIRAAAVRHYGADAIHKLNALRVPKFATGGVLGERGLPAIPPLAPSLEGPGKSLADYGSLQINLPDGTSFPAMVQHDTAKEIRRQARMRGKSSTR